MDIIIAQPTAVTQQPVTHAHAHHDTRWLLYFNIDAALQSVIDHVKTLPSSQTAERHTAKVYKAGLAYWLNWAGQRLPTPDLVRAYVSHLIHQKAKKPLKSTTIAAKYLAPIRHLFKFLAAQQVQFAANGQSIGEWQFVADCREQLRAAAAVQGPRPETTSNVAPLWRSDFVRLTAAQVKLLLGSIETDTRMGARDHAFLSVAFNSGLRLAELQRLTLGSFKPENGVWLISVRGKRNNIDPVAVGEKVWRAVQRWVATYNAGLGADDPRRIGDSTPLWQPLLAHDRYSEAGKRGFDPCKGMGQNGLRRVIAGRAEEALGITMAAHDTRRTFAAMASRAGMPLNAISSAMRHKEPATTLHYIGKEQKYEDFTLSTYLDLGI